MKTKTQHTPTPWKVDPLQGPIKKGWAITAKSEDKDIDRYFIVAEIPFGGPFTEANAEFIVRACNNYEELLRALKEIARGTVPYSQDPLENATDTIESMKQIAKDAIQKAEEK